MVEKVKLPNSYRPYDVSNGANFWLVRDAGIYKVIEKKNFSTVFSFPDNTYGPYIKFSSKGRYVTYTTIDEKNIKNSEILIEFEEMVDGEYQLVKSSSIQEFNRNIDMLPNKDSYEFLLHEKGKCQNTLILGENTKNQLTCDEFKDLRVSIILKKPFSFSKTYDLLEQRHLIEVGAFKPAYGVYLEEPNKLILNSINNQSVEGSWLVDLYDFSTIQTKDSGFRSKRLLAASNDMSYGLIGREEKRRGIMIACFGLEHSLANHDGGFTFDFHFLPDEIGITRPIFSDNTEAFAINSSSEGVKLINLPEQKLSKLVGHQGGVRALEFSPDSMTLATGGLDQNLILWDVDNQKEKARFVSYKDGEWISITPEGFFNSSPNGAKYLNVRIGNKVFGIDQFYDALYRPDLVEAKLQGDPLGLVAKAAEKINLEKLLAQGSAPRIEFTSHKSGEVSTRDIKPEIEIIEKGGGIGKVLWKLNGTTVGVEEPAKGRTLEIDESLATSKRLTLSPGENIIEVTAYNKDGGMASDPYTLRLNLKDEISETPSLHILAVGVNKYRDKSLWLNYAVPDSKELVSNFQTVGKNVFEDIYVTELLDRNASLSGIEAAFSNISKVAKTSDVFVLYLAGHGITLDGRYHFLPVDFRYYNEDSVREKAITQDHLQKWLSQIPARKSLVLLDTCNSGSFVEAQAVTRGIAEKTAITKLTRATGRATIAASMDEQVALEGYEGHGVFTYALLQALSRADTEYGNRDGVISTMEMAAFVGQEVPDMTYEKWGYEQVPQVNLHGREFPIGVTVH